MPQVESDAQQLFGLPAAEETLETFSCSLVQSYSCRHNAFTGPKEVPILARLHQHSMSMGTPASAWVWSSSCDKCSNCCNERAEPLLVGVKSINLLNAQVVWRGTLYITDRHSCWKAQGDSTTLMLPHADVTSAEKLEKGG